MKRVLMGPELRALHDQSMIWASSRKPPAGEPAYIVRLPGEGLFALGVDGEVGAPVPGEVPKGYSPLYYVNGARRNPLEEVMFADLRRERMALEAPSASAELLATLKTRSMRLLHSFQSTPFRDAHVNHGDQGPFLRDFGFPPSIAGKLIEWGYQQEYVCTFENGEGVSGNEHCWKHQFLADACHHHMALFGSGDLPENFIQWAIQVRRDEEMSRKEHERATPRG